MSHDHDHHHGELGNIKLAFFLNLGFTVLEIFGGLWTNSLVVVDDEAAKDDILMIKGLIHDLMHSLGMDHSTVEIEYNDEVCRISGETCNGS